jgi:hypothetical protein
LYRLGEIMHSTLFRIGAVGIVAFVSVAARADVVTETPYAGITYITRTQQSPRNQLVRMHIALIDLTAPGIGFQLSPAAEPTKRCVRARWGT